MLPFIGTKNCDLLIAKPYTTCIYANNYKAHIKAPVRLNTTDSTEYLIGIPQSFVLFLFFPNRQITDV